MALPIVTVDTLLNHPNGLCSQYTREALEILLPLPEFTAIDILTRPSTFPDGSSPTVQDRLYSVMREDVITPAGVETVDQWVMERFAGIEATTVGSQNCKNNWPQPTPFQRAVMLSDLMRYETGSDTAFTSELLAILESI